VQVGKELVWLGWVGSLIKFQGECDVWYRVVETLDFALSDVVLE